MRGWGVVVGRSGGTPVRGLVAGRITPRVRVSAATVAGGVGVPWSGGLEVRVVDRASGRVAGGGAVGRGVVAVAVSSAPEPLPVCGVDETSSGCCSPGRRPPVGCPTVLSGCLTGVSVLVFVSSCTDGVLEAEPSGTESWACAWEVGGCCSTTPVSSAVCVEVSGESVRTRSGPALGAHVRRRRFRCCPGRGVVWRGVYGGRVDCRGRRLGGRVGVRGCCRGVARDDGRPVDRHRARRAITCRRGRLAVRRRSGVAIEADQSGEVLTVAAGGRMPRLHLDRRRSRDRLMTSAVRTVGGAGMRHRDCGRAMRGTHQRLGGRADIRGRCRGVARGRGWPVALGCSGHRGWGVLGRSVDRRRARRAITCGRGRLAVRRRSGVAI